MLNDVEGFFMEVIANTSVIQEFDLGPLPPGTDVYATISLSHLNTTFSSKSDESTFAATAYVESWTVYNPDGTESARAPELHFAQNAVAVFNCARIKFVLAGKAVAAVAQINAFTF